MPFPRPKADWLEKGYQSIVDEAEKKKRMRKKQYPDEAYERMTKEQFVKAMTEGVRKDG